MVGAETVDFRKVGLRIGGLEQLVGEPGKESETGKLQRPLLVGEEIAAGSAGMQTSKAHERVGLLLASKLQVAAKDNFVLGDHLGKKKKEGFERERVSE